MLKVYLDLHTRKNIFPFESEIGAIYFAITLREHAEKIALTFLQSTSFATRRAKSSISLPKSVLANGTAPKSSASFRLVVQTSARLV